MRPPESFSTFSIHGLCIDQPDVRLRRHEGVELERDRLLGEAGQRRRAEHGGGGALEKGAAFHVDSCAGTRKGTFKGRAPCWRFYLTRRPCSRRNAMTQGLDDDDSSALTASTASPAPTSSATTKPGALAGAMPAKVSLNMRPNATAGLANDVDAVNQ